MVVLSVVNEVCLRAPAALAVYFQWPHQALKVTVLSPLQGPLHALGVVAGILQSVLLFSVFFLACLLGLRLLLKRDWLAGLAYAAIWAVPLQAERRVHAGAWR